MHRTTVYIPDDLRARVKRVAEEQGRSEADVIRAALAEYTSRERPRPRAALLSVEPIEDFDEALRGFGEE
jgi:predicted transcriptional regulator